MVFNIKIKDSVNKRGNYPVFCVIQILNYRPHYIFIIHFPSSVFTILDINKLCAVFGEARDCGGNTRQVNIRYYNAYT